MSDYAKNVELLERWRSEVEAWLAEHEVPVADGVVGHLSDGSVVMEVSESSFSATKPILESTRPIAALWDPNGDHEERIVTMYSSNRGWMSIDCVIVPTAEERAESNS